MFQPHSLTLVDLTRVIETCSADAYVDSDQQAFVGVQVSRSTADGGTWSCTCNKGRDELLDQIDDKGFFFILMLFWRKHGSVKPENRKKTRDEIEACQDFQP